MKMSDVFDEQFDFDSFLDHEGFNFLEDEQITAMEHAVNNHNKMVEFKSGDMINFQLALRQNEGVCVFQDRKNRKCTIQESKPLNCFSYPFMIHKVDNNHFTIEVDFSCPGIREESQLSEHPFLNEIVRRISVSERKITDLSFKEVLSLKWDLSEYFRDGERVSQDEINEASNFIIEEYSSIDKQ